MLRIGYFAQFVGEEINGILVSGDATGLRVFASSLRTLERPGAQPVRIHQLPGVLLYTPLELVALPVGEELGVRLREDPGDILRFDWSHSEEGWLEAAEKIEVVATSAGGHNYLGETPAADAVIVVSLGEYPPDWWKMHTFRAARE